MYVSAPEMNKLKGSVNGVSTLIKFIFCVLPLTTSPVALCFEKHSPLFLLPLITGLIVRQAAVLPIDLCHRRKITGVINNINGGFYSPILHIANLSSRGYTIWKVLKTVLKLHLQASVSMTDMILPQLKNEAVWFLHDSVTSYNHVYLSNAVLHVFFETFTSSLTKKDVV